MTITKKERNGINNYGFSIDKKIRVDVILTILGFILVTTVGYTRLQSQVTENTKDIESAEAKAEATYMPKETTIIELRAIKDNISELKKIQQADHDVLVEISTQLKELNKKR